MITAPNTPTTAWIKDSGTVVAVTTDIFIDELGNFFVDESGNNLLDSVSSDGNASSASWSEDAIETTAWASSFEARMSEATRTTVQGDTRTTVQGDTRTVLTSSANRQNPASWTEDEY